MIKKWKTVLKVVFLLKKYNYQKIKIEYPKLKIASIVTQSEYFNYRNIEKKENVKFYYSLAFFLEKEFNNDFLNEVDKKAFNQRLIRFANNQEIFSLDFDNI